MQYEWLHSHALLHVQTINQRIIYHSKPSSVIQLHVRATNKSQDPNKSFNLSVTVTQNDQ